MSIEDMVAREIERLIKTGCEHQFIDAKDGTRDNICIICGMRAKQAVMFMNRNKQFFVI